LSRGRVAGEIARIVSGRYGKWHADATANKVFAAAVERQIRKYDPEFTQQQIETTSWAEAGALIAALMQPAGIFRPVLRLLGGGLGSRQREFLNSEQRR
jgi:DICT domain-containing protein